MSDAWDDYVAAARRLSAVRRGAAAAAGEQAQALRAAQEQLAGVHARLAPQRAKLLDQGAPEAALQPSPADVAAAAQSMVGGPAAVLGALRQARATADAADATVLGTLPTPGAGAAAWLRNLIVYGPFAAVVLLVQIALYATADRDLPLYAVLCGLTMPAAAFGLGWLTIGIAFPPPPDGRVERTALLGVVVCFAPVVATCMGVGVLSLVR